MEGSLYWLRAYSRRNVSSGVCCCPAVRAFATATTMATLTTLCGFIELRWRSWQIRLKNETSLSVSKANRYSRSSDDLERPNCPTIHVASLWSELSHPRRCQHGSRYGSRNALPGLGSGLAARWRPSSFFNGARRALTGGPLKVRRNGSCAIVSQAWKQGRRSSNG